MQSNDCESSNRMIANELCLKKMFALQQHKMLKLSGELNSAQPQHSAVKPQQPQIAVVGQQAGSSAKLQFALLVDCKSTEHLASAIQAANWAVLEPRSQSKKAMVLCCDLPAKARPG